MNATTMKTGPSPVAAATTRVPALTILSHPDVKRTGERVILAKLAAGGSVRLSRLTPKFAPDGAPDARAPLADPHLSRTPIFVEGNAAGGVEIVVDEAASTVSANGVPVRRQRTATPTELERGVVLELGARVTLLLHFVSGGAPTSTADDDGDDLGLVGQARSMAALRQRIRRVARHDVTVLLRGESGTGKELVARAIHRLSNRANRELISVNMAAIPPTTAASALFGHARGAFTGAVRSSRGYFGRADGGTLFLDEIGDTPYDVQPALLRALETGEVHPVGEESPGHADVRLVAATDVDLEDAVRSGRFRQALFQRLGGYMMDVPSLRERREDVGVLLAHFLRDELTRIGRADRLGSVVSDRPWLPSWLVAMAACYDWPGNVRELKNLARQLAIDWGDAPEILHDSTIERLLGEAAPHASRAHVSPTPRADQAAPADTPAAPARTKKRRRLDGVSNEELVRVLEEHLWQPAPAAAALGISRTSLYALMDKHPEVRTARELGEKEIAEQLAAVEGDTARAALALRVSEQGLKRQMRDLGMR